MSNTGKENIKSEKILTRNNEEHYVEIDEISDLSVDINNTQTNVPENKEFSNDDLNKKNVVLNLDIELDNVMKKSNELEQKCTVLQLAENKRKTPSIWVQYYRKRSLMIYLFLCNTQVYGKQSPSQQFDRGHGGGSPLSYDPESRNYFVKFVFVVLLIMLMLTAAYGVLVLSIEGLNNFYKEAGYFLMIGSMVVLVGMNYVMACSACARYPPCNFVCLVIVVIAMSNLVGAVTVRYKTEIIVLALFATIITVGLCILLACSKFDFTSWYIYVVVIAMVFMAISMVIGITMMVLKMRFKPLQIVLLVVGTIIQVVILIMELQMILGGKTMEIGEDDYALAAYMLYTSIVDIFLHIVQLMGLLEE